MKHLLGKDGFTFAVLDDVLMSVDKGHRREVCKLLLSVFPNTQFVLTTHDGVWLRYMKTTGLIESQAGIEFRKWNVDCGPSEWRTVDTWSEIDDLVSKNDVRGAAALLRNQLEHLAAEYCALLGGRVTYQGDGHYELGDLLPGAVGALGALFKKAKAAANSWGNTELVAVIDEQDKAFATSVTAALGEQWQINPLIHYNEWANLEQNDFTPVVAAFKDLTARFVCAKCNGLMYITYSNGVKDTLRCSCSALSLSLVPKKAAIKQI